MNAQNENRESQIMSIDTVVIGGGQAGLCVSYTLQIEGREHVNLEKDRILGLWFSER